MTKRLVFYNNLRTYLEGSILFDVLFQKVLQLLIHQNTPVSYTHLLILAVLYLLDKNIKLRERIAKTALLVLLYASFDVNVLNYICLLYTSRCV